MNTWPAFTPPTRRSKINSHLLIVHYLQSLQGQGGKKGRRERKEENKTGDEIQAGF